MLFPRYKVSNDGSPATAMPVSWKFYTAWCVWNAWAASCMQAAVNAASFAFIVETPSPPTRRTEERKKDKRGRQPCHTGNDELAATGCSSLKSQGSSEKPEHTAQEESAGTTFRKAKRNSDLCTQCMCTVPFLWQMRMKRPVMRDKACQKDSADRERLHQPHSLSMLSKGTQTVLHEFIDPTPGTGQPGKEQNQTTADDTVISCESSPIIRLSQPPGKNVSRVQSDHSFWHDTSMPVSRFGRNDHTYFPLPTYNVECSQIQPKQ